MTMDEKLYIDLFKDISQKNKAIAIESLKQTLKTLPKDIDKQQLLQALAHFRVLSRTCPPVKQRQEAIEARFKKDLPHFSSQFQLVRNTNQAFEARLSHNIKQSHIISKERAY